MLKDFDIVSGPPYFQRGLPYTLDHTLIFIVNLLRWSLLARCIKHWHHLS